MQGRAFELRRNGETVQRREVHEIASNQEESDTRMALYAEYGANMKYKNIKIRTPDSDVFFILLHCSGKIKSKLLLDIGSGNSRRLLNIMSMATELGQKRCTALMNLHAYTGCDTTGAFKGQGKVKWIKLLEKKPIFKECFSSLGLSWDGSKETINVLESFTCSMYGHPRQESIDTLQYDLLKKKCDNNSQLDSSRSVDLGSLPPCFKTLV